MSYGRSRYFFRDTIKDPLDQNRDYPKDAYMVGLDLEDIQEAWLTWDNKKPKEFKVRFRQKVELTIYPLDIGYSLYNAWREYCEAKNL